MTKHSSCSAADVSLTIHDVEELYTLDGPDGWVVSASLTTPAGIGVVTYWSGSGETDGDTLTLNLGGPATVEAATTGQFSTEDVERVCSEVLEQVWDARTAAVEAAVAQVQGTRHSLAVEEEEQEHVGDAATEGAAEDD